MSITKIKENKALLIRNNKSLLLKRLNSAKNTLLNNIKSDFKDCKFDFENACLIGKTYKLQWLLRSNPKDKENYYNQQTTTGICILTIN